MSAAANPYSPPSADLGSGFALSASDEAVAMRQQYLNHEAAVRSIGSLYYLSAGMLIVGGAGVRAALMVNWPAVDGVSGLVMAACVGLGVIFGVLGRGLRALENWARIPVALLSAIGMLDIGFGTLVNGYILYLVLGAKGKVVFSDEYAAVRAATPEIRYKTPLIVKLLVGALLLAVVAGLGAALFGAKAATGG